jgi:RNA polymerase sigma-70 factor (ECF subfamily)
MNDPDGHLETDRSDALSDVAIVGRVLAGDAALFELIMRRYNRLLFRLARAILRNDEDARDAVQVAYVRAYYHLSQFKGPTGFKSWLARIVVNEANTRLRRSPTLVKHDDQILTLADWDANGPEGAAITGDLLEVLQTAIDRLPEEFRSVFMLRGVEQLSIAETAEVLDIKAATVKTRFHRARRLLQESLHRKLDDIARETFRFDGNRCDRIVSGVLTEVAETTTDNHGGIHHDGTEDPVTRCPDAGGVAAHSLHGR